MKRPCLELKTDQTARFAGAKKKEGMKKRYYRFSKQSYAKAFKLPDKVSEAITVGIYDNDGKTTGELEIKWTELMGATAPVLSVYDDAWNLFQEMPELFKALSKKNDQNLAPDQLEELLESLGYEAVEK